MRAGLYSTLGGKSLTVSMLRLPLWCTSMGAERHMHILRRSKRVARYIVYFLDLKASQIRVGILTQSSKCIQQAIDQLTY